MTRLLLVVDTATRGAVVLRRYRARCEACQGRIIRRLVILPDKRYGLVTVHERCALPDERPARPRLRLTRLGEAVATVLGGCLLGLAWLAVMGLLACVLPLPGP